MQDLIGFNMDHRIDLFQQYTAPFDTYFLSALVFVVEKTTNKSVPITGLAVGDPLNNFITSSVDTETKSNYTYDSGTGPTTVVVESRVLKATVERSMLAKAFTMCMLTVNWALTAGSVYITLVVANKRVTHRVTDAVPLVPVTVILTIPAIRALYVGSPPFGIFLGRS
jgi:hypothetical protein